MPLISQPTLQLQIKSVYLFTFKSVFPANFNEFLFYPFRESPVTSGHLYLAIYYVSTYYTAGSQVGNARGQVTYSRFKNVRGFTFTSNTTISFNIGSLF